MTFGNGRSDDFLCEQVSFASSKDMVDAAATASIIQSGENVEINTRGPLNSFHNC